MPLPLAVALAAQIPVTVATADLIIGTVAIIGATATFEFLVKAIRTGHAAQALEALRNLRESVEQATGSPAGKQAIHDAGGSYIAVQHETFWAILQTGRAKFDPTGLYQFATLAAANEYKASLDELYLLGTMPRSYYLVYYQSWLSFFNALEEHPIAESALPVEELDTLPSQLPVFATVEALNYWYDFYAAEHAAGSLTWADYGKIYDHYLAEYGRLTLVPTEPTEPSAIVRLEAGAIVNNTEVNVTPTVQAILPAGAIVNNVAATDVAPLAAAVATGLAGIAEADLKAKDDMGKAVTDALAALSAAQAAATLTAGQQVAAGSQAAAGIQAEATTSSGVAVAAAVTALSLAAATEFAKIAKTWGHDVAAGARTCWASTAADLFAQIAGAAVPLTLSIAGEKFDPIRQAQNALMERVFEEIWNAPELRSPIGPDGAIGVATALFRKAFQLGQLAHLLSVLAETVTPLKTLGLGQVAAFLADMAGFAKIGGAMMGSIESQALARPWGYQLNARTLTNRPNAGQLGALASDQAITRQQYVAEMAYQGYASTWAEELYDTAFRALAPRQLQMMAEAGIADDAYFDRELVHSGLRPETIALVKEQLRLAALGELKPVGDALARKRYREGLTSEADLSTELIALGYRGIKLSRATALARLDLDTELVLERIKIIQSRFLEEEITAAQLLEQLKSLGLTDERAVVIQAQTVARFRPAKVPDRLPNLRERLITTYLSQIEAGIKDKSTVLSLVLGLGYTAQEADLALQEAGETFQARRIEDRIKVAIESYIDKELTLEQLRARLLDLKISTDRVNDEVELARLRAQPTPRAPTPDEIPQLTTAQVLAAFRADLLTEAQVRAELAERLYQPADIDVIIAIERAKEPAPAAAKIKAATETQLKSFLAAGLISVDEFLDGLTRLGYDQLTARRILELEAIKAEARVKP